MATQSNSKVLNELERQPALLLSRAREVKDDQVSVEFIARKKTLLEAVNLCIDLSGLDDKEIGLALGIDAGHLSNIRKGKAGCNFPLTKLDDLMTLCKNEVPLIWQALKRGKGLHLLEGEAERQLRVEREARLKAEDRLQYLEGLYRRT